MYAYRQPSIQNKQKVVQFRLPTQQMGIVGILMRVSEVHWTNQAIDKASVRVMLVLWFLWPGGDLEINFMKSLIYYEVDRSKWPIEIIFLN